MGQRLVKMVKRAAGPAGVWPAGSLQLVSDEEAAALIQDRAAVPAERAKQRSEIATAKMGLEVADDLTQIDGIGPATAKALAGIGIMSLADLAEADAAALASAVSGIDEAKAGGWIEAAGSK